MFYVKISTIVRQNDNPFYDRVYYSVGKEMWNENENYVVENYFFIPKYVTENLNQAAVDQNIRETIAGDAEAQVTFAEAFPWE